MSSILDIARTPPQETIAVQSCINTVLNLKDNRSFV